MSAILFKRLSIKQHAKERVYYSWIHIDSHVTASRARHEKNLPGTHMTGPVRKTLIMS